MIVIDGNEYEIAPFLGLYGWKIQVRLGKMLAPAIKEAIAGLDPKKGLDGEVNLSQMGGAISTLLEAISANDPNGDFVAELLSQTTRNGAILNKNTINSAYQANYLEMGKALIEVIKANNFFGIASSGVASAVSKMAQHFPANSTKS